jgi:hypothetical protein
MSYDLHVTRRRQWVDSGDDIGLPEWLDVVEHDPELELRPDAGPHAAGWRASQPADAWLEWRDGAIHSKNPDAALIDKMVAIARLLRAHVQGDDGETYVSGREPAREYRPSLWERATGIFERFRQRPVAPPAIPLPPFDVGDRVVDTAGNKATVIEIDTKAMHGFGSITARYDDGSKLTFAMFAHNLRALHGSDR